MCESISAVKLADFKCAIVLSAVKLAEFDFARVYGYIKLAGFKYKIICLCH